MLIRFVCLFLFIVVALFSVQNTTKRRLLYSGWIGSSLLLYFSVVTGECEFVEVLEVFFKEIESANRIWLGQQPGIGNENTE